ncbi:DUF397 domain-containing protein [Streptomyces decoyicus]
MAQQHAQRRRLAVLHTADFDVHHHGHAANSPPSPDDNAADGPARPSRPRHDPPDKAEAYGSGCCVAEPVQPRTQSAEPALRTPRPEQAWRKSSYSSGGGNCIVATAFGAGTVAVHDSKNPAWTRPVRRLPRRQLPRHRTRVTRRLLRGAGRRGRTLRPWRRGRSACGPACTRGC